MRPPKKNNMKFERIKLYDEWIPTVIEDVTLEENRLTGFNDDDTGEPKRADQVRFKFALEGHEYPHYSRWMSYGFSEKSNLFTKYLIYLVENAEPDMEFDLDTLKGMKVKTMWCINPKNTDFDNMESIRPVGAKVSRSGKGAVKAPMTPAATVPAAAVVDEDLAEIAGSEPDEGLF